MRFLNSVRHPLLATASLSLATALALGPAHAQDTDAPPEEDDESVIIVTGTRVTQGGAQDVKHFRSIALDELNNAGLPETAGFTSEGLLSEHDLDLPSKGGCEQLFCVASHAKSSATREGEHFLGIGFESGVDAEAYKSEPLSLIALVDRSGSMSGAPIETVKRALHALVDHMGDEDRVGIVIYGTTSVVHQEMIDVAGNKRELRRAINAIEIDGSTSMEAGMKLGYATAFKEVDKSRGKTRMMLFTDENPNTGNTSPEGFMAQAVNGSRKGVGLTTIGVGRHFDAGLATKVSSVRGGNLFFLPDDESSTELFTSEFANMSGAVAHDLVISIDPADGVKVGAIYGVPDTLIEDAGTGTITVTIGSAFLSSKGGGIFATLEGEAAEGSLAEISVSYTDAITEKRESDADTVIADAGDAPANLVKAELLIDQYDTTRAALAQWHQKRDAKGAAEMLEGLSTRIAASGVKGLKEEVKLVDSLTQKANRLAGLSGGRTMPFELFGEWKVTRHKGVTDISRGDLIEISDDGEFTTERTRGPDKGDTIYQYYALNERQMHIEGSGLVFNYRVSGDKLTLVNRMHGTAIVMVRDES